MPHPTFGVKHQQARIGVSVFGVEVISAIQLSTHGPCNLCRSVSCQRCRNLFGQAAAPRHDALGAQIIQSLVDNTKALVGVLCHPSAAKVCDLIVAGLAAIHLVHGVFLEKQRISHAAGRASECAVAAHRHRVGIRCNAPVGIPVCRIAQLTSVDHVVPAGAAPHPVIILTEIVHVRRRAGKLDVFLLCRFHCRGASVRGGSLYSVLILDVLCPVVRGLFPSADGHHNAVCILCIDDFVILQVRADVISDHLSNAGKCHRVPLLKVCADAVTGNFAVVQHNFIPAFQADGVLLQGRAACIQILGILGQ